ncbi:hypothetical protein F5J12DRAFT_528882 [Pisolithus orientalis]|uniref:uncharacterized protein n=1 Tax=Pisolithus orientalis TaxID=936130 RepID=UPI002224EBBC|nr:uncharacterized protein F5J12DRAFT_528882 [Pisolithus orientalis]KAI5988308.1 hypothetical protein F5J12DRAFT_528882 [Pisolithus orientalis]
MTTFTMQLSARYSLLRVSSNLSTPCWIHFGSRPRTIALPSALLFCTSQCSNPLSHSKLARNEVDQALLLLGRDYLSWPFLKVMCADAAEAWEPRWEVLLCNALIVRRGAPRTSIWIAFVGILDVIEKKCSYTPSTTIRNEGACAGHSQVHGSCS